MHLYDAEPLTATTVLPAISSCRFRNPLDLVDYAAVDRTIGWKTWPEVWHLDAEGALQCGWRASTLDSIKSWAADPSPLLEARAHCATEGGCTDRCVVVDSRPAIIYPPPAVDESDVAAFAIVSKHLADVGVRLLDVVVFDDRQHWWSLHEFTTGATEWD